MKYGIYLFPSRLSVDSLLIVDNLGYKEFASSPLSFLDFIDIFILGVHIGINTISDFNLQFTKIFYFVHCLS